MCFEFYFHNYVVVGFVIFLCVIKYIGRYVDRLIDR